MVLPPLQQQTGQMSEYYEPSNMGYGSPMRKNMLRDSAPSFIGREKPAEVNIELLINFQDEVDRAFRTAIDQIENTFKDSLYSMKSLFFKKL